MAKSKAAKRKRTDNAVPPQKIAKTSAGAGAVITPPPEIDAALPLEPKRLQTVVSDEELEITIDTLRELAKYPSLLKSKGCKDLRVAVYDFRQACTTGAAAAEGSNLTGRITAALTDERYLEARILLAEMRLRSEAPKLGALCRWVRDIDLISGLSSSQIGRVNTELMGVMDAVLRVSGPTDGNPSAVPPDASSPIALQPAWDHSPADYTRQQVYASVQDKTIFNDVAEPKLRIVDTTEGPDRKPPNQYPAVVYLTSPNSVPLDAKSPQITVHMHPHVPGLRLLQGVLSPTECKAIIAAGEHVGFMPDAPLRGDGDVSILAHNFYWLADQAFHDGLWGRVAPHLPASLAGRQARGINRRFRVYRYVPGAEYRCHIDGAWPPSGVTPEDRYVYDASPTEKKQSSLFTFLVYLNDEFEGGETTFFLPAAADGVLNAYPVRPLMGSVAVFPHGEATGALLHEGTGVRKGAKYIIRTDVEYDVETS